MHTDFSGARLHILGMTEYRDAAVAYLREVIEKTGRTASELADMIGVSHTTFTRPLKSPAYKYAPKFPKLQRLAELTSVPLSNELTSNAAASSPAPDARLVPNFLLVRYKVQAGLWYEVDTEEPPEQFAYPVAPDPAYGEWPQWLELVVGDSFNLEIKPGHYAHVVDAFEMGYQPRSGDWVIVERRRDEGAIRERTIKEVEIRPNGSVVLWPRSDSAKWADPVEITKGARDGEEIEAFIVGYVIGSYSPRRIRG